jgi:hypothetical protein
VTSPYARPDVPALADLERVLGALTEELAGWRRRCLKAEQELLGLKSEAGMVPGDEAVRLKARVLDLEKQNLELQARLDRTREMVTRVRGRLDFLDLADGRPPEEAA